MEVNGSNDQKTVEILIHTQVREEYVWHLGNSTSLSNIDSTW